MHSILVLIITVYGLVSNHMNRLLWCARATLCTEQTHTFNILNENNTNLIHWMSNNLLLLPHWQTAMLVHSSIYLHNIIVVMYQPTSFPFQGSSDVSNKLCSYYSEWNWQVYPKPPQILHRWFFYIVNKIQVLRKDFRKESGTANFSMELHADVVTINTLQYNL